MFLNKACPLCYDLINKVNINRINILIVIITLLHLIFFFLSLSLKSSTYSLLV